VYDARKPADRIMSIGGETTFRIAFWAQLVLLFAIRAYYSRQVHRAGEKTAPDRAAIAREGILMFVLRIASFLLLLAVLALYAVNPDWLPRLAFTLPVWLRWSGFALSLAGLVLLAWSQHELGRLWSSQLQLRSVHRLVTSGPYARVRHPLYTAICGWAIGVALLTASWLFAGLAGVVCLLLPGRVPREEAMMLEQFGEEYRAYMKRAGRFFPK
jgi:protein-S-isoprenylcysteine O-methyltransferase Ste14